MCYYLSSSQATSLVSLSVRSTSRPWDAAAKYVPLWTSSGS